LIFYEGKAADRSGTGRKAEPKAEIILTAEE
jgi:hypothetical protein